MITKYICLESYSSSKGWIGYINIASNDIDCSIAISCEIIRNLLSNVLVLSTLTPLFSEEDTSNFWELDARQMKCINTLISKGIIGNSDEFSLIEASSDTVDCVNLIKFTSYALGGHVFYTNQEQRIFIYPHDDIGIGFILKSPDESSLFIEKIKILTSQYKNECRFFVFGND